MPTSIPEPLVGKPAPARPTDFLPPTFHKQRRELLRTQLPPNSVAVVFAAPVRNRPNDVNYVYHQNPDFHYLTGYEEPDAVLLLFKEPRTVGGQPGITEALFTQPRPMDCGAEYHGYSADVTRTAPPTGTFSPAQRQIYGLVLAAQEAGFAACKPGADFNAPNKAKPLRK
jgi:Xaa-Pro aminopeptidase